MSRIVGHLLASLPCFPTLRDASRRYFRDTPENRKVSRHKTHSGPKEATKSRAEGTGLRTVPSGLEKQRRESLLVSACGAEGRQREEATRSRHVPGRRRNTRILHQGRAVPARRFAPRPYGSCCSPSVRDSSALRAGSAKEEEVAPAGPPGPRYGTTAPNRAVRRNGGTERRPRRRGRAPRKSAARTTRHRGRGAARPATAVTGAEEKGPAGRRPLTRGWALWARATAGRRRPPPRRRS